MKNKIIIIITLIYSTACFTQQKVTWEDLSKVTFSDKYFPAYDQSFLQPVFSPSVKALDGTLISITGYFLNIDPRGEIYILSKGPMSSCFFCGASGPETAIELKFSSKPNFKTDNIVTISGTLNLNADNVEHFNYILTACKGKLVN